MDSAGSRPVLDAPRSNRRTSVFYTASVTPTSLPLCQAGRRLTVNRSSAFTVPACPLPLVPAACALSKLSPLLSQFATAHVIQATVPGRCARFAPSRPPSRLQASRRQARPRASAPPQERSICAISPLWRPREESPVRLLLLSITPLRAHVAAVDGAGARRIVGTLHDCPAIGEYGELETLDVETEQVLVPAQGPESGQAGCQPL